MGPRWLTRAMVVALHQESLAAFGGLGGIRDEGLLESVLARLAAAYGFGLARNHPFTDGNTRVAVLALAVFLAINGMDFDPDGVDEVRTILALAAGEVGEEELAEWIRPNTQARTPGP